MKQRLAYLGAGVGVVGIGLLWRSNLLALPVFLRKYGGDAWWAVLVYLLIRAAAPGAELLRSAGCALAFSFVIEFSQIYHAVWIDGLRATRLGALVIGSVFNPPDLMAYAVGIGLVWVGDSLVVARRKSCQ